MPSSTTRPVAARVPNTAHAALQQLAAERNSTVSAEIARLVDEALRTWDASRLLREQQAGASKLERV